MKNFIFIFISFLFFLKVNSQEKKLFDYELVGALVLESAEQLLSFKIEFNSNKKGFIQGYSYTDMGGENETKSYIEGYYNPNNKEIAFKESDILYTKSKFLPEEFCFISFKGKFKENSKKKLLNGEFIGIYNDKDTCATGKIKLVSIKFAEKKINKIYKKVKKIDKIKKIDSVAKAELNPENYLKKFSETRIASGETVSVFVYTREMKMEIWDYGKEDGDVITIYHNNVPVLENFTVSKRKKSIIINLEETKNILKIITVDSGKLETNTSKLKLYDFRREYEVVANLEKGKAAIINVVKLKGTSTKKNK